MGGDNAKSNEQNLSNTSLGIEQQYLAMAQTQLGQQQALTAPLENYNTGIINSATSGDKSALISAAGPQISNITALQKQAQESAYNNIPAGAGRDAALAQGKMQEGTNISTALNQLFQNALTQNAQLGQAAAGIGLQETGAGLNALNQSSTANQAVMQANESGKSSSLGFLGSLAGVAGQLGAASMISGAGGAAADAAVAFV